MIPQRSLSRVNSENGVRYRVAACRQRLRNSRITPRATNHSHMQVQSPELTLLSTELIERGAGYFAGSVGKITTVPGSIDDCGALVIAATEDSEKVGIT